jgi:CxxC motif-containing protein (DUF1111 family)
MRVTRLAARLGATLWLLGLFIAVCESFVGGQARAGSEPDKPDRVAVGYEIFNREWLPNDARSHGGDGLGPVFNDSSCVACHNSGGSGGAGPVSKNIDLLTVTSTLRGLINAPPVLAQKNGTQGLTTVSGAGSGAASLPVLDALAEVHAGFRTSRNVVLHKFGSDPNYEAWRERTLSSGASNVSNPALMTQTAALLSARENLARAEIANARIVASQGKIGRTEANLTDLQEKITQLRTKLTRSINGEPTARKGQAADSPTSALAAAKIQELQTTVLKNAALRSSVLAAGQFLVTRSQRNPTPLFGLGLIDAIPAAAIEAMAQRQAKDSPEIHGRASHVKDGRIGRLGWKGQVASVEDFVLNACAVELGLEVPGHHQAIVPQAPRYRAAGLDLTAEECNSLVAYVKSLPKPDERQAVGAEEAKVHASGRAMFASIGCAGCHSPRLGDVQGIYADLLLHDMGPILSGEGSYDDGSSGDDDGPIFPPETIAGTAADTIRGAAASAITSVFATQQGQLITVPTPRGAMRQEWRTPPLWGFRDSGPYLHDGRAETLDQAVAMHGGQGTDAAHKFFELSPRERLQVEAFLKSLVAPTTGQVASR